MLIMFNVNFAKLLQYLAPIVLGMISVITSIKIVSIAETIANEASPNNLIASAPTPAAPIVWATVFRDKIADRGLSICVLNFRNEFAHFSLSLIVIKKDCGVDRRTDSVSEHIKETNNARNK